MELLARLEDWAVGPLPDDARWAGRVAVRFSLGLAPWGWAFAGIFAALGLWALAASLTLAGTGVLAAVPVLRASRSTAMAGHLMTASLVQSLLVPAWHLGGLEAACVPWLALCVVAATLFAGRGAGIAWAAVAVAAVWGMLVAQLAGALPAPTVPPDVVLTLAAGAHSGLLLVTLAIVVAATDVIRRARDELEVARISADRANHAKSDFLARMSHELRTPLNAILGYSELLSEDADAATAADLRRIRESGTHLLQVVNDVLDLAKVEAGRMEFRRERVDVHALVRSALEATAPLMAERDNRAVHALSGAGVALADELRLRQCLMNLLGNAAKFTRAGEVRVVVQDVGDRVHVEVHDTGIGMTEAELARVFEPFAQASDATARTHGGTGLGLAIVRQLVERLGGRVEARSSPGRGSVFVLALPRPAPDGGS